MEHAKDNVAFVQRSSQTLSKGKLQAAGKPGDTELTLQVTNHTVEIVLSHLSVGDSVSCNG